MPFQDLFVGSTPAAATFPVVSNANLSFGGVPTIGNIASADLNYGSSVPSTGFSTYDTNPNLFSTVLSSIGFSSPQVASAADQYARPVATTTQINTAQVDGSTGFISNLQGQLGTILGAIGSTGDSPATVTPVAYAPESTDGVLSLPVILAVLAVGGVIYFASQR